MNMKKVLLVVCLFAFNSNLSAYDFYVSPDGNDSNPGTKNSPVSSLSRITDRIEKLIEVRGLPAGGITVNISPGTYFYKNTLVLDSGISGGENAPVVFKTAGEGKAVFDGGKKIETVSAVKVSSESEKARLNKNALGSIYCIEIQDRELRTLLSKNNANLSYNGQMMNIAKWPNVGFAHIDKIIEEGAVYAHGRTKGDPPKYSPDKPIGGVFTIRSKDVGQWAREYETAQKAQVVGYLSNDWYKQTHRIANIEQGKIKLLEYSRYGINNREKIPRRLVVKNLLCELDSPGEFYYDDNKSKLYFMPFDNDVKQSELTLWAGAGFAEITGTKNIRFENIVVQGVSQGKTVFSIQNSSNIELAGCVIRNSSRPGVWIIGGKNCGLRSCDLYDLPSHLLLNGGNVRQLTPAGHYAVNCHFTQVQASDFYGRITVKGVGQIFKNNLIHNFNGQIMVVGDNEHVVEYNEFFNIGIEEGDGGCIYSGAQMWSWGNVYRHNFLHHLMCIPQAHPRGGIYPDDHDAGDTITENIFYKAAHRSILMNNGAGHTVTENIFLNGYIGIYNTYAFSQKSYEYIERYDSGELKRGDKMDHIWRTEQVVGEKGWNNEPWKTKYPLFAKIMNQEKMRFWPIECVVKDNLFYGNVYDMQLRTGWKPEDVIDMREYELIETSGNKTISMDVFNGPEQMDFTYKAGSAKSMPDIQFNRIGLYKDEYRPNPPDKGKYRQAVLQKFENRKSYDPDAKYDPDIINEKLYFNTGKLIMEQ